MQRLPWSILVASLAIAGCLEGFDEEIGSDDLEVINAAVDHGHRAVGMVQTIWEDGAGGACTGTVIGPRTVLTAGHCVSHNGVPISESAFFPALDVSPDMELKQFAYRVDVHPDFDMPTEFDADNDVALLHLVNPIDDLIEPMTVQFTVPPEGTDLVIVGHGCNTELNAPSDFKKRAGPSRLREIKPLHIALEHRDPNLSTVCHGDSGGPALLDVGGEQVIVGVHSQYEVDATGVWAEDARLDIAATFIQNALANPPIAPHPLVTGISFEMRGYPALIIDFDPEQAIPTDVEYDVGSLSFRDPPDRYSPVEWDSDRRAVMALPAGAPEGVQPIEILARNDIGAESSFSGELDLTRPDDGPDPGPDPDQTDGGGCGVGGGAGGGSLLLVAIALLAVTRRSGSLC